MKSVEQFLLRFVQTVEKNIDNLYKYVVRFKEHIYIVQTWATPKCLHTCMM